MQGFKVETCKPSGWTLALTADARTVGAAAAWAAAGMAHAACLADDGRAARLVYKKQ